MPVRWDAPSLLMQYDKKTWLANHKAMGQSSRCQSTKTRITLSLETISNGSDVCLETIQWAWQTLLNGIGEQFSMTVTGPGNTVQWQCTAQLQWFVPGEHFSTMMAASMAVTRAWWTLLNYDGSLNGNDSCLMNTSQLWWQSQWQWLVPNEHFSTMMAVSMAVTRAAQFLSWMHQKEVSVNDLSEPSPVPVSNLLGLS